MAGSTDTAQATRWQRLRDFLYIKPWYALGETGSSRLGWGFLRALIWVGMGAGLGVGIYFASPAMAFMGVAAALAPYFWAGAAGMALTSLFMFAHAWHQRAKGRMGWYRAKLGLAAIFMSPLLAAAGLLIPGLLGTNGLLSVFASKIGAGVVGEVLAYYVIPAAAALLSSFVIALGLGRFGQFVMKGSGSRPTQEPVENEHASVEADERDSLANKSDVGVVKPIDPPTSGSGNCDANEVNDGSKQCVLETEAALPTEQLGDSTESITDALSDETPSEEELESVFASLIEVCQVFDANKPTACADLLSNMDQAKKNAVINRQGDNGHTPLGTALVMNNVCATNALLDETGIDVNQLSKGIVPLTLALHRCDQEVVNKLVGMEGINLNAADHETGRTPLMAAAGSPSLRNCDANKDSSDRLNPWNMLIQATNKHEKSKDIQWGQQDTKGCTVWHYVLRSGNGAAIYGLTEAGGSCDCLFNGPPLNPSNQDGPKMHPLLLLMPGDQPQKDQDKAAYQIWHHKQLLSAYMIIYLEQKNHFVEWLFGKEDFDEGAALRYMQAFDPNVSPKVFDSYRADAESDQPGSYLAKLEQQNELMRFLSKRNIEKNKVLDIMQANMPDLDLGITEDNERAIAQAAHAWLKEPPSQEATNAPSMGPGGVSSAS